MSDERTLQPIVDLVVGRMGEVEQPRTYYQAFADKANRDDPLALISIITEAVAAAALARREVPPPVRLEIALNELKKPESRANLFFRVTATVLEQGVLIRERGWRKGHD